ncbi:MAG: HAD family phosphatase [Nitrospirae bacterium]|nr:HAD family phosphatase [Nitrospirota bacterium]
MLKAIIFDFDGVITDSEPVHLKMFQKVLGEMGLTISERDYYEIYLGMDDKGCFSTVLKSNGFDPNFGHIQSLIDKKTIYLMDYIKDNLFIYPGVVEFVESSSKKYLLAIASGALRHEIEFILEGAGIRPAFNIIVSAEDVSEGKPNPECFNKALNKLNEISRQPITTADCLVIEDSIAGIEAAKAAGMLCAAVTNTYNPDRLKMADIIVNKVTDINLEKI